MTEWGLSDKAFWDVRFEDIDFEKPLTNLIWITSLLSIIVTFVVSKLIIPNMNGDTNSWWVLATIISCGTLGAAIIPEFTKIFTRGKLWYIPLSRGCRLSSIIIWYFSKWGCISIKCIGYPYAVF